MLFGLLKDILKGKFKDKTLGELTTPEFSSRESRNLAFGGDKDLKKLADLILKQEDSLTFTILEIGSAPLDETPEPFHQLLDLFPGSQILAFEVEKDLCERLNKTSKPGIKTFPIALGRTEETRTFYETRHPMCCSLYRPNERLISLYNNFEVAYLKSAGSIETVSLDYFTKQNNIGSVDFIKIDIQGAELEVFQGGYNVLDQIVAMVCEVEFIPHYINQPLFGDVCAFLSKQDIMFHKFLGLFGSALSPIVVNNDPNFVTQHIWSDAVFIRDIFKIPELSSHKLLKLGMLAYLYGSPDLTYHCFHHYDKLNETDLKGLFLALLSQ
ncbi:MAG: FkbM family methyltransferase [Sideroxyarcus sp.]